MKKYFAIVLAAVAAIACQKEINGPEVKGVFTASVESYDETKTFTDATLQVKWSEGDLLNVWDTKATSDKYTITSASVGQNTAELELVQAGQSTTETLSANVGYYPYADNITCTVDGAGYKLTNITLPATQTYVANSFANGAFPMVAVTKGKDDRSFAFKNVCGVLRIVLSGDMLVKTISVMGNNNEVLCGNAEVSASNIAMPAITMTGDGKTVTLDCGDGIQLNDSEKKSFDIVLPPMTFEKGFSISVNGEPYFKTDKQQAIVRSRILCMGNKAVVSNNYLKFTSEGETSIALTKTGAPDDITLLYFKASEGEWKTYTIGDGITLADGESLYFKAGDGGNSTFSKNKSSYYQFTMNGEGAVKASGNIMSLLDQSMESLAIPCIYCFYNLFHSCTKLTSAPELPATTLAYGCYHSMFQVCNTLTSAPELPATTLVDYCYQEMFSACSSLTSVPKLPATTLANFCYYRMFSGCAALTSAPELHALNLSLGCYQGMFYECTSLTSAPELPATTLADKCYSNMFVRCTSLTSAPILSATTLKSNCYSGMFDGCTSLTTAPELPATNLVSCCYQNMFGGCSSLTTAPELPATALAYNCYFDMFNDCSALISAPKLPATTLASGCYEQMFMGCKSLTSTPELPATTLVSCCYQNMFSGCTKLNYVKALFTTIPGDSYTANWLRMVSSTGTFVKNAAATWDVRGTSGIPEGWEVKTEVPPTDLSEAGTANCYIVSNEGTYKFKTVQGNTETSVGTVASASILWESYGTDTAPSVGDLVSDATYADGYITFKASDKKGNAVIAAKDADGNILWSWHIWLTDKPVDQVYNNNAGTMMDRNLGATSATKGDMGALGLLYQWGRKDPFLGGCSISYSSSSNQTKAASTINWPSAENASDHLSGNNTLAYATANPTVFLKNSSSPYDWYCTSSTYRNDNLWTSTKTAYDPCPAGYRVPDGGINGIWSKAFGTSSYWETSSNWDSTNKGMDFGSTDKTLGTGTIWYPASGYLYDRSGALDCVGHLGEYWSCTPYSGGAHFLYFTINGDVIPSYSNRYRAFGKSVRCVSE